MSRLWTIAAVYFAAWVFPSLFAKETRQILAISMLFEFIIIHSTAAAFSALASKSRGMRILQMSLFTAIYLLFVVPLSFIRGIFYFSAVGVSEIVIDRLFPGGWIAENST